MSSLSFEDYLRVEATGQRTVALKLVHVDMAGDLTAGVLLSQLVYWHRPSLETGEPRLRFEREGHLWLRKAYDEWHEECRLTVAQARRAIEQLRKRKLVETRVWKHRGAPTLHLRIVAEEFMAAFDAATMQVSPDMRQSADGLVAHSGSARETGQSSNGNAPERRSEMRQSADPSMEETTSETTHLPPTAVPATAGPADDGMSLEQIEAEHAKVVPLRNGRALQAANGTLNRLKAEVEEGHRSWSLSEAATAEWLALLDDDHGLRAAQEFVVFYLAVNTGRDVRDFAPAHWSMAGLRVRRWRSLVLHGVDEAITRVDPDEQDERGKVGQPFWAYVEKVCQSAHARNQEGSA